MSSRPSHSRMSDGGKTKPVGEGRVLWEAAVPKLEGSAPNFNFGQPGVVRPELGISPDGSRLVLTGVPGGTRVLDAATGVPVGTPFEDGGLSQTIRFAANGTSVILFPTSRGAEAGMRAWDAKTGRPTTPELAQAIVIDPARRLKTVIDSGACGDGKSVWTATADALQLWEVPGGRALGPPRLFAEPAQAVASAPGWDRYGPSRCPGSRSPTPGWRNSKGWKASGASRSSS